MRLKKFTYSLAGLLVLSVGLIAWLGYNAAFKPILKSQDRTAFLVYPEDANKSLGVLLDPILKDTSAFVRLAKWFRLERIKPGRYVFEAGSHSVAIIRKLRKSAQDPVNLTINNVRDVYQLSGKFGQALMHDSTLFIQYLTDSSNIHSIGYNEDNILCLFIPNTYQVYWTITPEKLVQRMLQENLSFWSKNDRLKKAEEKGLHPNEAYIMASIVEKETTLEKEKGLIAGVYLNRLDGGMKLQADPTVVYALGMLGLQRVLLQHLKIESPYNTYQVEGLPPGPIWMPSESTLDSVLLAPKHDFLFFCARPGNEGGHAFAETLQGHYQNARMYRQWLNSRRIY